MTSIHDRIQAAMTRAKYSKDESERWITIGDKDREGGGTHIKIDGSGNIVAGPEGIAKQGIHNLKDFGKKDSKDSDEKKESDPSKSEPEQKHERTELDDLAEKHGRKAVPGAKKVNFSVHGLSRGDDGDPNGTVRTVKGVRYVQVDRTKRSYWSRDDLEDQDMFQHEPGGAYSWTGVPIQPTEIEAHNDAAESAYKQQNKNYSERKHAIENKVRHADNYKHEIDMKGMKQVEGWGNQRMASSERMYTDGENRLIYTTSSYDDGPYSWELHDPELAKEAASLVPVKQPEMKYEPRASLPARVKKTPETPVASKSPEKQTGVSHQKYLDLVNQKATDKQPIKFRGKTFDNKDAIKSLGAKVGAFAKWDGDAKVWRIDPQYAKDQEALAKGLHDLSKKGVEAYQKPLEERVDHAKWRHVVS